MSSLTRDKRFYAGGCGPVQRIFVVSRAGRQFFEIHELDKALAAYCAALAQNGYEAPAIAMRRAGEDQ